MQTFGTCDEPRVLHATGAHPQPPWRAFIRFRALRPHEFDGVLERDLELYNTPLAPPTADLMREWAAAVPESAFAIETASGESLGVTILIPLKPAAWSQLVGGHAREGECTAGRLYDIRADDELALHISQMDRRPEYPAGLPQFGVVALYGMAEALYAVQRRREALGRTAPLRLAGLSGLGVTPHGINLTISVYGSRERSYICPEHTLWAPMREQEGQRGQEVGGGNVAGGAGGGGGGGGAGGGGGGGGGQGQVQQTYVGHTRRTYRGPGGKWERKLEVHTIHTQEQLQRLLEAGYELLVRCRMLALLPHEPSLVWTIVPRVLGGAAGSRGGGGQQRTDGGSGIPGGGSCKRDVSRATTVSKL